MSIESYYDKKSANYDAVRGTLFFRVYDKITWQYLEPYVPSSQDALVLDAAGGTGTWTVKMAKKGCRVVLVDISDEMLNVAREKIEKEGLQHRVEVKKGDIKQLDYPEEAFDMVLCEHALFLFKNQDQVMKELVRVLKKKAPIIISAQNRYAQSLAHLPESPVPEKLEQALNILLGVQHDAMAPDGAIEIYSLTPSELRDLLERNGLRVEKIVCKGVTTPLRLAPQFIMVKDYSEDILNKMLKLELAFCERQDALALAAHLQAIAYKL